MTTKKKNHLSVFSQHRVTLEEDSTGINSKGECPFCNHRSFSVKISTGQWHCFKCDRKGNTISFIRMLWETRLRSTTTDEYKQLSELRPGITPEIFEKAKFAYDAGVWLIPGYNDSKTPNNIYLWKVPSLPEEKTKVLATATMSHCLFNAGFDAEGLDKEIPIFVCEGPWDTLALQWLLTRNKQAGIAIGVPGMSVWKPGWNKYFHRRKVYFAYDKDPKASSYMLKAAESLSGIAFSVSYIEWPDELPQDYDVRDMVVADKKKPAQCYQQFIRFMVEASDVQTGFAVHPNKWKRTRNGKPKSFKTLLSRFRERFHVDQSMAEALAIILGTVLSNAIPGDPLWIFLVGPSGIGKTAFLKSLSSSDKCYYASTLTSHSLVSGFAQGNEDPSLLPKLRYGCLVLKDYTEIMTAPIQVREELYGTLRGAFDGSVNRPFGNNQTREYTDLYFSMVAGVTDAIHSHQRAALGERFLKVEFTDSSHDPVAHIRAAISGMKNITETEEFVKELVSDFLDRDPLVTVPQPPSWVIERVIHLSTLVEILRTSPQRERGEILVRPGIGTRLSTQLIKLGQSLCIVYSKTKFDMEVYLVMEKVGFNTALGRQLNIFRKLIETHPQPQFLAELGDAEKGSKTSLKRTLENLSDLGMVESQTLQTGYIGRNELCYKLTDRASDLWHGCKTKEGSHGTRSDKKSK